MQSSIDKGYRTFAEGNYKEAATRFLQVYKSCSHSYNIVCATLESILLSKDNSLLREGMKIMKIVLQNAASFLRDCTAFGVSSIDSQNKNVNPRQVFTITYELYDSSSHNMEPLIHCENPNLVGL